MTGYFRIVAAAPALKTADVGFNTRQLIEAFERHAEGAALVAFPELALSGGDCGDLFFHDLLLRSVADALWEIAGATVGKNCIAVVGAPVVWQGKLYNAAAVIQNGEIADMVFKPRLKICERRYFHPGDNLGRRFVAGAFEFAVSFGFDPSAANSLLTIRSDAEEWRPGIEEQRRRRVGLVSDIYQSAQLYTSGAGDEESACLIGLDGRLAADSGTESSAAADIDFQQLAAGRRRDDCLPTGRVVELVEPDGSPDLAFAGLSSRPFLPPEGEERDRFCRAIFARQAAELARRAVAAGAERLVLGVSGGLDSTLALLAAAEAVRRLGRAPERLLAVAMPGFGTTGRTAGNAEKLAKLLRAEYRKIEIAPAVNQHFLDIGHDPEKHDTTYENAQARERTQILFDLANSCRGLVVGTGDLSEIALGWSTFGGDHLAMYSVNAGIPKTTIPEILLRVDGPPGLDELLRDIIDTPVSPELLPPGADGEILQETEAILGPYALHDFFLYYFCRGAANRRKLQMLAQSAFDGEFTAEEIASALEIFFERFFRSQFKRNCAPESVRVGEISLDGIDGFRLRSDIEGLLWRS